MKEMNLGRILIENRHKRGITQEELATHIGVSKGAVSKWETNSSLPDISLLPQLASYFDITIDELIGYEPQMEKRRLRNSISAFPRTFPCCLLTMFWLNAWKRQRSITPAILCCFSWVHF